MFIVLLLILFGFCCPACAAQQNATNPDSTDFSGPVRIPATFDWDDYESASKSCGLQRWYDLDHLYKEHRYTEGLTTCNELLVRNPDDYCVLRWKHDNLVRLRNFAEVPSICDQLLVTEQRNLAQVWAKRAQAERALNHFDLAISAATKAIEVDPTLWHPYMTRGECYGMLGFYHVAMRDIATAEQLLADNCIRTRSQEPSNTPSALWERLVATTKQVKLHHRIKKFFANRYFIADCRTGFSIPAYHNFREKFPTLEALECASPTRTAVAKAQREWNRHCKTVKYERYIPVGEGS